MRIVYVFGTILALVYSGAYVAGTLDASRVHFVLPQDAIPAILDPQFGSGSELLRDDSLVVGVEVNGEAKAYPVAILNWHEVVNDEIGGTQVAVTWCPLCYTAVVFERDVHGETLTFKVSGKLYRNNLVMYDVETGSLWSQAGRECIEGAYAGTRLALVTSQIVSWDAWVSEHPDTAVLEPPGVRDYRSDPYRGYERGSDTLFPVAHADSRLHPKAIVYGVEIDDAARAYPLAALREERVVNDVLGGRPLVVTWHKDMVNVYLAPGGPFEPGEQGRMVAVDGTAFDVLTGEPANASQDRLERVEAFSSYWFSWHDFQPHSDVYGVQGGEANAAPIAFGALLRPIVLFFLLVGGYAAYKLVHAIRERRSAMRGRSLWRDDWVATRDGTWWGAAALAGALFIWADAGAQVEPIWQGFGLAAATGLIAVSTVLLVSWVLRPRALVRTTRLAPEEVESRLDSTLGALEPQATRSASALLGVRRVRYSVEAASVDILEAPGGLGGTHIVADAGSGDAAQWRRRVEMWLEGRER